MESAAMARSSGVSSVNGNGIDGLDCMVKTATFGF
jgi:hypothetical protein